MNTFLMHDRTPSGFVRLGFASPILRRDLAGTKPDAAAKLRRNDLSRRSAAKTEVKPNEAGHTGLMHFVYILETTERQHWYIGTTDDIDRRLAEHNAGKSPYTSEFKQWKIKTYTAFIHSVINNCV